MDISLILWGMLCSIELFTGYIIVNSVGMSVEALFPLLMMLIGLVFLFMANRERLQIKEYIVIYRGYEQYVYYSSYLVVLGICLCIITGVYTNTTMISPVLMITWLMPMISYSIYHNILCFQDKQFRIANKWIRYKNIKKIKVEESKRNKKRLYLHCNDKNYYYVSDTETIEKILNILHSKNKQVKKN